jgi:hypothetical protein
VINNNNNNNNNNNLKVCTWNQEEALLVSLVLLFLMHFLENVMNSAAS